MATEKKGFFAQAFEDMKASAAAQHEADKAQFAAVKAEARVQWEEAKMTPKAQAAKRQAELQEQIAQSQKRQAEAEERIEAAKKGQKK